MRSSLGNQTTTPACRDVVPGSVRHLAREANCQGLRRLRQAQPDGRGTSVRSPSWADYNLAMAEKWADFLISAVEHSESPRHIARVALRLDRGEKVGPAAEMSRPVVMAWLRARYSIATIYQGTDKIWQKGGRRGNRDTGWETVYPN